MADRRKFLRQAGQGTALGLAAAAGAVSAREFLRRREREFRRQWKTVSGLVTDPAVLDTYSRDFGRQCYQRPLAVVYPESVQDVQELVSYCNEQGVPLNTRGLGHAQNGQSLIGGGIILDLKPVMNTVRLSGEEAEAEAGASWMDVQRTLIAQGRGVTVCPDFMAITVGGSVAVGGIGARSMRAGTVADSITELELVTGQGEVVRCSRTEAAEYFRFARFGLGQAGVITKVRLRTRPYQPHTLYAIIRFHDFPAYYETMLRLLTSDQDWPSDLFYGGHIRGSFFSAIWTGLDLGDSAAEERFRSWCAAAGGEVSFDVLNDYELTYHNLIRLETDRLQKNIPVWLDFFLPPELYGRLNRELDARFRQPEFAPLRRWAGTYDLLYPSGSARDAPLAAFPQPPGRWVVSTGLYFSLPASEPGLVDRAKALAADLIRRYAPLGAGLYLYGFYRLSAEQRRQLWGAALDDYFRLTERTDPHRIIHPTGLLNSLRPGA